MTKSFKRKPIIVSIDPNLDTTNAWLQQFANLLVVDYKNGLLNIELRGNRILRVPTYKDKADLRPIKK